MAYSMFERPKLYNAKSLKFYPEERDHHVSFRHKNLPSSFELTVNNSVKGVKDSEKLSLEAHASTYRKCPIYTHDFEDKRQEDGDFVLKSNKQKKLKTNRKSMLEKLEEKYWANWKPDKNLMKSPQSIEDPASKKEIKIIKSAPDRRRKVNKSKNTNFSNYKLMKNLSKSQEIQTDNDLLPPKPPTEEVKKENKETTVEEIKEENTEINSAEVAGETKFLRHTDSLILTYKKKKEDKESFDQPKCIRLYRKSGKVTSKNYIRGGSYPLKSCLKKESNTNKPKLGRPGSPIIHSSNYSNKHARSHHRH